MKDFRVCLKGLWNMYRPVRWKVRINELVGLSYIVASLFIVWGSKKVVDMATGSDDDALVRNIIILVVVMFFQIAASVFAKYWQGRITVHTQNLTRREVFGHVMKSVWSGREKFHSGDTVNRLEDDIQEVSSFLSSNVPETVVTILQLLAASAYFFFLSPELAWILLLIMPFAVGASCLFFLKMRRLTGEIRAADSRVQGHMQENIQHRTLVKTVGSTDGVIGRLDELQDVVWGKTLRRLGYSVFSMSFMRLGFAAGYALVFIWGVMGLKEGTVTYGMMVAFLQLVGQVQRPVVGLASQVPALIRAMSSEERLLELMEQPLEEKGEDIRFDSVPGIRVENVSFTYEGDNKPVLDSFSFDFRPGTLTAVVGCTGAGKSTLIRLLLSLLPAGSGNVVLYDDSRQVPSSPGTRCNFMYVPQGNSLMSGTIRDNLLMAGPDATEEELLDVLETAAADFVFRFKDGIDTQCTEVGGGLSEGQAQRIAVARALLRPGGILILDEASSALDSETEERLMKNLLEKYRGRKTIICITHRPFAKELADYVLELS